MHTLRVFTNTVQIPTLVLDESGLPVQEKTHPKFSVSLDGSQPVTVGHVRLEGEDPISLALLLDESGSQSELLRELKWSFPQLAGRGLREHDHVSIYALDCTLVKTLDDAPANKEALKAGFESALKSTEVHGGKARGTCADKLSLRDGLMAVATALKQLPGRRIIMAFSDGADTGSKLDWAAAANGMQHFGTTVFGVALAGGATGNGSGRGLPSAGPGRSGPYDPALNALCEMSGGLMLTANDRTLSAQLQRLTELVRARYIIEFKRSDELTAGRHPMAISVVGKNYFIRSAGASMPIADPKLKDDPSVVRVPAAPPASE